MIRGWTRIMNPRKGILIWGTRGGGRKGLICGLTPGDGASGETGRLGGFGVSGTGAASGSGETPGVSSGTSVGGF
jgi:hypothetical protein